MKIQLKLNLRQNKNKKELISKLKSDFQKLFIYIKFWCFNRKMMILLKLFRKIHQTDRYYSNET